MIESQNIEYKESWRTEYLKWVCGFANAQGGTIYVGIDDKGKVVGLSNIKKLMEDIPNQIQAGLGIVADVNKATKDGLDYIEIKIEPSNYPVNYHGEYHYRSGSTKQQLQGVALTQFLLDKTGARWDAVPVGWIHPEDLDEVSLEIYKREGIKKKRLSEEDMCASRKETLERLNLLDNGNMKRAAVMLFYPNPSRMIEGCYMKIGKFGEGADLQYQDMLEGSLFRMADQAIDLIYTKYLKAKITYEHDVRVEMYPFPREGVREAIYNALAHNNYARSVPIQIRIEENAMYISNSCILPTGWNVESLMRPHRSVPFNPSIANAFYRAGYIEAWGRGIQKICEACRKLGTPNPEYTVLGDDITVKFTALESAKPSRAKNPKHQDDVLDDVLDDRIVSELKKDARLNQKELANRLQISVSSIQRAMYRLKERGKIVRKGGKRYGHWEVKLEQEPETLLREEGPNSCL